MPPERNKKRSLGVSTTVAKTKPRFHRGSPSSDVGIAQKTSRSKAFGHCGRTHPWRELQKSLSDLHIGVGRDGDVVRGAVGLEGLGILVLARHRLTANF